jgi:PKD repeat protein
MNKIANLLLGLIAYLLSASPAEAQTPKCAMQDIIQNRLNTEPGLRNYLERREGEMREYRRHQENTSSQPSVSTAVIPIVIHTVYDPSVPASKISHAQIDSQITALNREFAKNNVGIKFCLASKRKDGQSIWPSGKPGVNEIADASLTYHTYNSSQHTALSNYAVYFPKESYLNIWLVSTITANGNPNILGYSNYPSMPKDEIDGIVIRYDVFGNNSTGASFSLYTGYSEGKTLVHEAAHYLNIFHIFDFGCQPTGTDTTVHSDYVFDTPKCEGEYYKCVDTVGCDGVTLRKIHNYMDYTADGCKYQFTPGQGTRMFDAIALYRGELVSEDNLIATGISCVPVSFSSGFSASQKQPCMGESVTYTPTSTSGVTYNWSFTGGNISGSTAASPTVIYPLSGTYGVTLTVTDGASVSKTTIKNNYIYVTECIPIQSANGNWYFGRYAGLNFASGKPVATNGLMITGEPSAAVSNSKGQLLFYTNGQSVYGKSGDTIAYDVLNGSPNSRANGYPASSTQGALIVPDPGNGKKFYIFTTSDKGDISYNYQYGLSYTVIDTSLNGGKGGVSGPLNQSAPGGNPPTGEHLTAIPHCNGTDYWIIAKELATPRFAAYLLTSSGLSSPQYSSYTPDTTVDATGILKAAPNGRRLAMADFYGRYIKIYDFDKITGNISYAGMIDSLGESAGFSFSPNSNLIYARFDKDYIRQYDLRNFDCNSEPPYFRLSDKASFFDFTTFQLGPDGKLYEAVMNSPMNVINFPDSVCTFANPNACGLNIGAIPLLSGTFSRGSTPNIIDARKPAPPASFEVCIKNCGEAHFRGTGCGSSFLWTFGDPASGSQDTSMLENPVHIYTPRAAPYVVTFRQTNGAGTTVAVKTLTIQFPSTPVISGNFTPCANSVSSAYSVSGGPVNGFSYVWKITGGQPATATGPSVNVGWNATGTKKIKLIAINSVGCKDSAEQTVTLNPNPSASITISDGSTVLCIGSTKTLTASGGGSYLWNTGSTSAAITISSPGTYSVVVTDNSTGCNSRASVTITPSTSAITPDPVSIPCDGSGVTITASAGTSYLWSTGETTQAISVYAPGLYTVTVTAACGSVASVNVQPSSSNFTYPNGVTITSDTVWATDKKINGTLRIAKGAKLTIRECRIQFGANGEIVVESKDKTNFNDELPSGKLILEIATLTGMDACTSMWKGIRIRTVAYSSIFQDPYQAEFPYGFVHIKSGTVIEHAHLAISDHEDFTVGGNQYTLGGGTIWAESGTFRNNYVSVRLDRQGSNPRKITGCTFRCTASMRDNTLYSGAGSKSFIELNGSHNLEFKSNSFSNTGSFTSQQRGTALISKYSSYAFAGNSVNGLTAGIEDIRDMALYGIQPLVIDSNTVNNVQRGFYLQGGENDDLSGNTFTNIPSATAANGHTYGMYLVSCSGFTVSNNSFTGSGTASPSPAVAGSHGLVFENSGASGGTVYRNTFLKTDYGLHTQQNNLNLRIRCNTFAADGSTHFANAWYTFNGTLRQQGNQGCIANPAEAAGNTWLSLCTTSGSEKDMYVGSGVSFDYYANPFDEFNTKTTHPQCSSPLWKTSHLNTTCANRAGNSCETDTLGLTNGGVTGCNSRPDGSAGGIDTNHRNGV